MPEYRLHYFDSRGRAEVPRIMLNAAGKKFDDVRYTAEEWQAFKPKTPFGQLPCLEVDGVLYGESGAISKYLARELGFYGKNNIEALRIDVVIGVVEDMIPKLLQVFYIEKDEEKKKQLMVKLQNEDSPKFLSNLEKLLTENGNGYFVGDGITLSDLSVYDIIQYLLDSFPDLLASFPQVKANRVKVETHPPIANYFKIRK